MALTQDSFLLLLIIPEPIVLPNIAAKIGGSKKRPVISRSNSNPCILDLKNPIAITNTKAVGISAASENHNPARYAETV
jgi:hypothetical protein